MMLQIEVAELTPNILPCLQTTKQPNCQMVQSLPAMPLTSSRGSCTKPQGPITTSSTCLLLLLRWSASLLVGLSPSRSYKCEDGASLLTVLGGLAAGPVL
jgi:hypothetical protein